MSDEDHFHTILAQLIDDINYLKHVAAQTAQLGYQQNISFILRELKPERRYAVLVCFRQQTYRATLDQMIDMHDKLITGVYTRAQIQIDDHTKKQRKLLRASLATFQTLGSIILDEST